jgi:hypothetical protein
MFENPIAFEIRCDDLDIPEEGERVFLEVLDKVWSFRIVDTDIRGQDYIVKLDRDSGEWAPADPFNDVNLDLSSELGQ